MVNPLLPHLLANAGSKSNAPSTMSDAQRAFVDAAESLGATSPAQAQPLTELPRLSGRELDDLVDLGLVREAADWRYYVFRPRRPIPGTLAAMPQRGLSTGPGRWTKLIVFWLVAILIPLLFLQFSSR